jgi:hypothetical protein
MLIIKYLFIPVIIMLATHGQALEVNLPAFVIAADCRIPITNNTDTVIAPTDTIIWFTYDDKTRLTKETFKYAGYDGKWKSKEYYYDELNRLESIKFTTDTPNVYSGYYIYYYDSLSRISIVKDSYLLPIVARSYTYDSKCNNVPSIIINYSDTTTYSYNEICQPLESVINGKDFTYYTYDNMDRLQYTHTIFGADTFTKHIRYDSIPEHVLSLGYSKNSQTNYDDSWFDSNANIQHNIHWFIFQQNKWMFFTDTVFKRHNTASITVQKQKNKHILNVFPTITFNNQITVSAENIHSIKMFDISGSLRNIELVKDNNYAIVKISNNTPTGTYVLQISTNNFNRCKRIVVAK